jgi:hypothetical protein
MRKELEALGYDVPRTTWAFGAKKGEESRNNVRIGRAASQHEQLMRKCGYLMKSSCIG